MEHFALKINVNAKHKPKPLHNIKQRYAILHSHNLLFPYKIFIIIMYQKANMILCCFSHFSFRFWKKHIWKSNHKWLLIIFLTCSTITITITITMYNILKVNKRNSCLQTSKVTLTSLHLPPHLHMIPLQA